MVSLCCLVFGSHLFSAVLIFLQLIKSTIDTSIGIAEVSMYTSEFLVLFMLCIYFSLARAIADAVVLCEREKYVNGFRERIFIS